MASLSKGTTFVNGGTYYAVDLNNLVDSATPIGGFITDRSSATPASDDVFIFSDTSDSGNLKKGTLSDVETAANALSVASIAQTLTGTSTTLNVTPDGLAAIWEQGTDITAASPAVIPSTGGGYFVVTGNTTINGLSQAANLKTGRKVKLKFSGTPQLTHNATSFILLSGANITCAAGDVGEFICEDSTNNYWRMTSFERASGRAIVADAVPSAATQAEQEAASSTSVYVSPGRQHFHLGHPKAAVTFYTAGTISWDYGVTSITDTGTGDWTVNLDGNFSAIGAVASAHENGTNKPFAVIESTATGSGTSNVRIKVYFRDSGSESDPAAVSAFIGGDLA